MTNILRIIKLVFACLLSIKIQSVIAHISNKLVEKVSISLVHAYNQIDMDNPHKSNGDL